MEVAIAMITGEGMRWWRIGPVAVVAGRRWRIGPVAVAAGRRWRKWPVAVAAGLAAACQTGGTVPAPTMPPLSSVAVESTPPGGTAPGSAATSSPSPAPAEVTVTGVGDVIMGSTPDLPPDGGRGFFDAVRGQLRGDVVSGNVDAAITDATVSTKCPPGSSQCYAFRFPSTYARWLRGAGFTVLNLANNHSHDFGSTGLTDSQRALRRYGAQPTGLPGQVTVLPAGGLRVAVLGFAPYGWAQSLLDIPAAQRLVRQAAAKADLVVVNMHAGAEGVDRTHVRPGHELFLGEDRGDPIAFAHAVIDAGADLVIGHGPHVLRGMEWYRGHLIAYSMGNFAGYHTLSAAGVLGRGGILRITLRADGRFVRGDLVPTRMVDRGLPALDPDRQAIGLVSALSTADFGRCAARLSAAGLLNPPAC